MCGLVAVARFTAPLDATTPERIRRGLDALRHRGPDGEGLHVCTSGSVALGHRLLSVFAKAGAEQPLLSETADLAAVVNGEFYDELALKQQLEAQGAVFRSTSDSELLLHLYARHGLDLFPHLEGEFAFVLWDKRRKILIAARDRFGVKPLVWARRGEELAFASESKALFAMGHPPAWSPDALAAASVHQYLAPGASLFADIHELQPGTALVCSIAGVEQLRYFRFPECEKQRVDPEQLVDTLRQAVRRRLRGAHRPAFALSSGLDSSSVLALARASSSEPRAAFGLCFDAADYDESAAAASTARCLDAEFVPVDASRERQLAVLEASIVGSETLAINGQLSAKYLLAQAVQQHGYRVILTGEGADELFLGYDHLRQDEHSEGSIAYTAGGSDLMLPAAGSECPHLTRPLGFQPTFLAAKLEIGRQLRALFEPGFRQSISERRQFEALLQKASVSGSELTRSQVSVRLWMRTALASYILRALGDGTEMQHSIEGRVPFLDTRLCRLSQRLDTRQLITQNTGKLALRQALRGLLPSAVIERPKRPLVAPPLFWTEAGGLEPRIREVLLDSAPAFVSREALEQRTRQLDGLSPSQRRRAEPPLFMAFSAAALQNRFNPTWSTP